MQEPIVSLYGALTLLWNTFGRNGESEKRAFLQVYHKLGDIDKEEIRGIKLTSPAFVCSVRS
jgi:hypothetical protein